MEDNIFSDIIDSDAIISKYRAAPPKLSDCDVKCTNTVHAESSDVDTSISAESISPPSATEGPPVHINNYTKRYVPKFRIYIDSVDKVLEASMLSSSFIVYRVRFTRMSDLQSHATWKRYKEINTWYSELQREYVELTTNQDVQFPSFVDRFSLANQKDPHGEFVIKRKTDLENFFRSLFSTYPSLVRHPRVIDFFELNALPPETMNVVATRVAASSSSKASLGPSYSTGSGKITNKNALDSSSTAASSTSGAEHTGKLRNKSDTDWYVYDRSIMEDILNGNMVFDERTALMRRNNADTTADFPPTATAVTGTTVAELLNFEVEHSEISRNRDEDIEENQDASKESPVTARE
mmetsp:Transcript_2191/g.3451  ORF Transcript_2191/g.3451 Transcript_2191/m.3451 type:complete len:352 (-) Transcript_2191:86-1141(-)